MNIISAMKKYTASAGVLAMLATPAWALNVGDKMPDPTGRFVGKYGWANGDKYGHTKDYRGEDSQYTHKAAYQICKDITMRLPFGIFDFKTMTLYLDNDPLDGIIDEVVTEGLEGRTVGQDAPDCGEEI